MCKECMRIKLGESHLALKGALSPICSINLRGKKTCLQRWQPKIIV